MKVVLLCGGDGIRLKDQSTFIPKGMIMIDDKPLLWHIMKRFSLFGYNEFVLALGTHGDTIRNYFFNYDLYTSDVSLQMGSTESLNKHSTSQEDDWKITFVNTGENAHTGARLYRLKPYLKSEDFLLSYSDCLADVDIHKLVSFHKKNSMTATITGVMPPYRYGEFILKNAAVVDYAAVSKLMASAGSVNGGYMVMTSDIFDFLQSYNECTLENEVFKKLIKKKQLSVYKHAGFWQCIDNDREYEIVKKMCDTNKRLWLQK